MRKFIVIAVLLAVLVSALVLPGAAFAQQSQQASSQPAIIQEDLFDRASNALTAQQYDQAVLNMSLFILLNPTFSPAYYGRAQGYVGLNDLDHALGDVDHALDISATAASPAFNAALYALRGEIDRQQQHPDDAMKDYTHSINIAPSVQALANRGMIYMSQNDLPKALTDFSSAVGIDATNPVLYVYRGMVNSGLADAKAAGSDYLNFFDLVQTSTVDHAAIETGQQVTLQVDQGVVYHVPFTAKAGQYASALAVARSGSVDPLLVLLDSTGEALAGDDDSGGNSDALILNYEIPADGEYTLAIGHSLGGFTGSVQIQIQVSDQPAQ